MIEQQRVMPEPELCNVCCSPNIKFTTNDEIYGKLHGEWPHIWFCGDCRASVGCHKGTRTPLGRMANKRTRQLRVKAHEHFDQLWRSGYLSRDKAYDWLAGQLKIDPQDCHISWLNDEQLIQVAELSAEYLTSNAATLARRQAKKDAKNARRIRREIESAGRRKANGRARFPRRNRDD